MIYKLFDGHKDQNGGCLRVFPSREGKHCEAKPHVWVTPRNVQPSIIIDNNMIIKVIITPSI